ncbi:MAG TPA: hypothetical protein VI408_12955, partial [Gaiellaceae bacterium]
LDFSHHSQNLGGGTAAAIAGAQVVLEAVALVAILVAFMRGAKSRERFLRYAAAVTLAFVVFGKVLSPQYLIWVAPLVAVVPGRRGRRAMFLVALALIATQVWFPHRYWRLVLHFDALASWALLFRNLLLVAALALLILPRGRLARFLA